MKTIKVLAGSLAAITAGATLALGIFAAPITTLGDYVRVSGSSLNSPVIVLGSDAKVLDVVGAADIAAGVAGYATTPVSGGVAGLGVSGGVDISTANTKLYLDDSVAKSGVHSTLTKNDLPTILNSGSLTGSDGTIYNYDQYVTLNSGSAVTYSTAGGNLQDPNFILNLSTTKEAPVLNYTVTFNKLLNVSSSYVQNQKITILGTEYTIGSTSVYTSGTKQLVLYGSSLVQTMNGGQEQKVTVGGTDYTVKVLGASSSTSAAISVGGESQTVAKGTSYTISGLPVYVQDVFYLSSTDQTQNSVKLSFGTNKVTLVDGATVKRGTSDDTVDGTLVQLTGTNDAGISKITIAMAAKDSSHNYAQAGTSFTDPVFGALSLALGGLNGGSTENVVIDNSGTTQANLKFTDYRGNTNTLLWAYTGSSSFAPSLNSTSTQTYVVAENQPVKVNDYVLLAPSQDSDFGHVMQYTTSSSLGSSGAYIELKDVMSGATSREYLTEAGYGKGSFYIDGQQYFVQNTSSSAQTFNFTWGSGATFGVSGDAVTVFPLVRTSLGGWVTLAPGNSSVTKVNIPAATLDAGTTLDLPGGSVTVQSGSAYATVTCAGTQTNGTAASSTGVFCAPGRLAYNITVTNGSSVMITPIMGKAMLQYPAVIFREEKAKDATSSQTEVQDFVVTSIADGSGSGVDLTIQQPNMTAATQESGSLQSVNTQTKYVDRRGSTVTYDSATQGMLTIAYPDEQSVATVAVGTNPTFGGSVGGGTIQAAVKITSPVAKIASEVSATAPGADLILVGGPCANSLVATLLAPSNITCSNWAYTTGIIREVTGGFSDGSRALIIAGTQATDTRNLADRVIQGTLSYAA